jgi:hypothetical protein
MLRWSLKNDLICLERIVVIDKYAKVPFDFETETIIMQHSVGEWSEVESRVKVYEDQPHKGRVKDLEMRMAAGY